MLTPTQKQKIITKFAQGKGDTGSPQVQVALLSERITHLTGHLKQHQQDDHSRRGLLKMVSKRRRLLNYLEVKDKPAYQHLTQALTLSK